MGTVKNVMRKIRLRRIAIVTNRGRREANLSPVVGKKRVAIATETRELSPGVRDRESSERERGME